MMGVLYRRGTYREGTGSHPYSIEYYLKDRDWVIFMIYDYYDNEESISFENMSEAIECATRRLSPTPFRVLELTKNGTVIVYESEEIIDWAKEGF